MAIKLYTNQKILEFNKNFYHNPTQKAIKLEAS